MFSQYGKLRVFVSFGAPQQISTGFASWQRYCTSLNSGRQPNFAALNGVCHLYSARRPSRWALAHILVIKLFFHLLSLLGRIAVLRIYVDAAYCYKPSNMVCLSVGWSVCLSLCGELCKNGRTDRDTVWSVDFCGPK